jgi:CrcB protein
VQPLAVVLGGVLGTSLRFLLPGGSSPAGWDTRITVVIVVGAFVLGLLLRLPVRPGARSRLVPGVVGTLAGFAAATVLLLDVGPTVAVWLGILGIVLFGLVAAAIGMLLGHLIAAADETV